MDALASEFVQTWDRGHVGLADYTADGDEDFVKELVVLAFDLDGPLLTIVVEGDLLNLNIETKVRFEVEVFGVA